jgi:hypothetical protein
MKSGSRNQQSLRNATEDSELSPKPLSATLLQEFQNLKDKFKNDEDNMEKGMCFIHWIFKLILISLCGVLCCISESSRIALPAFGESDRVARVQNFP